MIRKTLPSLLAALVITAVAVALFWVATDPAYADGHVETSSTQQPYGGCKEAHIAPRSEGADECRDMGWTVKARIVLNPRGVIRYYNLDTCTYEDGSGSGKTCGWLGNEDGNGRGDSFYVTGPEDNRRGHYFWAPSPMMDHPARSWVKSGLADALAEGDGGPDRNWSQCWTRSNTVVCADSYRETW